jgi:NAD(P)-dependent dehydrogenase (short-subunit alcohol dehydrogenase family)
MSAPQIWFITGVSTGFGRALAEAALQAGNRVVGTVRDLFHVADLSAAHSTNFQALEMDLTDGASIRHAITEAAALWDGLDVLVNNAGYGLVGALEEYDEAQMARSLAINFTGPLQVIRAALPILRAQRAGRIIHVGAIAALCNDAGFSVYGGAKAAMDSAMEALRAELAPLGVKVSVVHPGPFRTDFISRNVETGSSVLEDYARTSGAFGALLKRIDGRQPGDPAKAAQAMLALAGMDDPPMRVFLGKYAIDKIHKKLKAMDLEVTRMESVGLPMDF